MAATWQEEVAHLAQQLGRQPNLYELIEAARDYKMTDAEIAAQRESWARGMSACEHGVLDFEDCAECRGAP